MHKFPFSTSPLPFNVLWERKAERGEIKARSLAAPLKLEAAPPVSRFILSVRQNGNVAPSELSRRCFRFRAPLFGNVDGFLSAGGWR